MPDQEFTPSLPFDFDVSDSDIDPQQLEGADGPCFEDQSDFEVPIVPLRSVSKEDRDAYIRLSLVNGIGPRTLASLVDYFGSATDVLKASQSQLGKVKRIGPKLTTLIRDASRSDLLERVYEHCVTHSVQIIVPGIKIFLDCYQRLLIHRCCYSFAVLLKNVTRYRSVWWELATVLITAEPWLKDSPRGLLCAA